MRTVNRILISGIIPALCLLLASCQPSKEKKWELAWEENFDREGTIDTLIWSKIPRGTSDWNKYMSDFDSCYTIRNGNLILSGIVNRSMPQDTAPYLTGGIYTKGKKAFSNGKLEIRAKLNGATGCWPAVWLLPFEAENWPGGGEIDIMERLNYDSIAYQTVHSYYTYTLNIKDEPPHGTTASIHPDDYNIYGVELYPDSIVFLVNGKHTMTYPRIVTDKEGQFPFDKPFYLLIDMQLGGKWVGSIDPKELPATMLVDWVKYFVEAK